MKFILIVLPTPEKAETEAVKEQLVRVQDEMTARTSLLEDELKSTWEKYRADNQVMNLRARIMDFSIFTHLHNPSY
jgi:hypothetical protein